MLATFLTQIKKDPSSITFQQVIAFIDAYYDYTPSRFQNGLIAPVINEAGTNEGSCRIFAFAQLNQLTEAQTLHCFGDYYRQDVLANPQAGDHANIRTFMRDGWKGIMFDQPVLHVKSI
jgi:hypothetical protein